MQVAVLIDQIRDDVGQKIHRLVHAALQVSEIPVKRAIHARPQIVPGEPFNRSAGCAYSVVDGVHQGICRRDQTGEIRVFHVCGDPLGKVPFARGFNDASELGSQNFHHLAAVFIRARLDRNGGLTGGFCGGSGFSRSVGLCRKISLLALAEQNDGHQGCCFKHKDDRVKECSAKVRPAGINHGRQSEIQRQVMHRHKPRRHDQGHDAVQEGQGGHDSKEIHVHIDLPGMPGEGPDKDRRLANEGERNGCGSRFAPHPIVKPRNSANNQRQHRRHQPRPAGKEPHERDDRNMERQSQQQCPRG